MPKILGEQTIFHKRFITVKDVDIDFDGKHVTFQITEKPNAAMVVALTADNRVVLLREYFCAIDETQLGLPHGRIDPGETPEQAAQRELQEEAGYKAGKLTRLGVLTMSPGYVRQRTYIFLAQELQPSKLEGDELQELEVIQRPFSDFEKVVADGTLTEGRMIAALYMARDALFKHQHSASL